MDFWFDPACPFTWITSRWVCRVLPERSLDVSWRPFSLALLHADQEPDVRTQRSVGQLRVAEAMRKAGFESEIGHLYTELGHRTHDHGDLRFPVTDALASCGLPLDLAAAADDESCDEAVRTSMEEAWELVGEEIGVPILAWTCRDGDRVGLFGPVLTEVPDLDTALRIFDSVVTLADVPIFSEVQRGRRSRPVLPAVAPD
jgi:hypothetical protein